jgi:hypothetical protein
MWSVYENGKPAKYLLSYIWNTYQYETLEEAVEYLRDWSGPYLKDIFPETIIKLCATGKPYDYNGYGDTFEIRYEN